MIPIRELAKSMGISIVTVWRYRKLGLLETVKIGHNIFVTPEAYARFVARAKAGEFTKPPSGGARILQEHYQK